MSFWPLKMIMRYDMVGVFQGNAPPEEYIDPDILANRNPREELRELRANAGGWKLAEKLITPWLHATINVYYWGTRATWTFYTRHCRLGKTPAQNVARINSWSAGGWERDELKDHVTTCFENPECLKVCGLEWSSGGDADNEQDAANNLVSLAFAIAKTR